MTVVPGDLDTDSQPPMAIPTAHFLVALGFLVGGLLLGLADVLGVAPPAARLAHLHLLLVGWICVTIAGAMTQFVPVWSGAALHSRRLAVAQLWLLAVGVAGLVGALLTGRLAAAPVFGALLAAGFWTLAYSIGRTLYGRYGTDPTALDATEAHFAVALACFVAATSLGVVLALDFVEPVLATLPFDRTAVVGAHATLAVFGGILATVLGALYQLATMFAQTELRGAEVALRRVETVAYPAGVVALAAGRLVEVAPLARLGGLTVALALAAFAVVLARLLLRSRVDRTPMLTRYLAAAPALAGWAVLAALAWLDDPLAPGARLGADGTAHLLALGAVGLVVVGTLYHVVPFLVWLRRYADLLGREPVPAIDDLYDHRVAAVDFWTLVAGTALLVAADWFALPTWGAATGGALVLFAALLVVANLLLVLYRHAPRPALRRPRRGSHDGSTPNAGDDVLER